MRKYRAVWLALLVVIGLKVGLGGIEEFDNAKTAIELLRGFFWMVVGLNAFWQGLKGFYKELQ